MARRWALVALALGLLALAWPETACAAPLTCTEFKSRLDEAITRLGDHVERPGPLTARYDAGMDRRYDWAGIAGLSGTMNCGAADTFEDFGISIDETVRTSDDLPVALGRLIELASASICAITEATPDACRSLVKTMTIDSLAQFKAGLNAAGRPSTDLKSADLGGSGAMDTMPTGTRDFFIVDGVDAELDMTPVGISWSIGPGLSMVMDAVKQPLKPRNADEK